MSDDPQAAKTFGPPPPEGSRFRATIGLMVLGVALAAFGALYVVPIPAANKDLMQFALGVVFGWAGSIIASEYGASATGRKAADAAIERAKQ